MGVVIGGDLAIAGASGWSIWQVLSILFIYF
jgi:hypothetical protein